MPTLAVAPSPIVQPPSIQGLPVRKALTLAFFAALWLFLCRHLSGEWSVNEQYNYGWFVPFFSVLLFWLRWEDKLKLQSRGQRSEVRSAGGRIRRGASQSANFRISAGAVCCLLLLLPLRLFEIGNPDWRPLGWLHAAVVVTLTFLIIWGAGGTSWLRHFAFPVAFIFVAVPWVTPIEAPVIQGMMRVIAATVSETLNLFGIPTQLAGNSIRVSSGLVGVSEACSGVRSLQTSLMIGLLLGEVKRLSIGCRVTLVVGAVTIAIAANFCRAFFLVWVAATKSISATERWHDFAGYSIVVAVFIGSLALASLLDRRSDPPSDGFAVAKIRSQRSETGSRPSNSSFACRAGAQPKWVISHSSFLAAAGLGWLIFVELAAVSWYRWHERNLIPSERWSVRWPASPPGFHVLNLDEQVRNTLRFDYGQAASWDYRASNSTIVSPSGVAASPRATCFVYFFRWEPGRNSALLANLHRPDVCLPAIGWKQVADYGVRQYSTSGDLYLPFRHFEFHHGTEEQPAQQAAHAFYCLWEDRTPGTATASPSRVQPGMTTFPSSWTRGERVRTVLEGRRHLGQQVMEVVLATHGLIDSKEAQADFAALLPKLIVPTSASKAAMSISDANDPR
jgi:exosortase